MVTFLMSNGCLFHLTPRYTTLNPVTTNWDQLNVARTCIRKLCLMYSGALSDRARKKKAAPPPGDSATEQTTLVRELPLDQPNTVALGTLGERVVEHEILGGMSVLEDGYTTPEVDLEGVDLESEALDDKELLDEPKETRTIDLVMKSWKRIHPSIVAFLDQSFSQYVNDPFTDLSFRSFNVPQGLSADLGPYQFTQTLPQMRIGSSGVLLMGIVDHLAITHEGGVLPLEVKTTSRKSKRDIFQLAVYLNALKNGGVIKITPSTVLSAEEVEVRARIARLRSLSSDLWRLAGSELQARIDRMRTRRGLAPEEYSIRPSQAS